MKSNYIALATFLIIVFTACWNSNEISIDNLYDKSTYEQDLINLRKLGHIDSLSFCQNIILENYAVRSVDKENIKINELLNWTSKNTGDSGFRIHQNYTDERLEFNVFKTCLDRGNFKLTIYAKAKDPKVFRENDELKFRIIFNNIVGEIATSRIITFGLGFN